MLEELNRNVALINEELKKCGSSPDTELSICKTLLQGCIEKKDSNGVKKWQARISAAEQKLKEYRRLCRKKKVFNDAISILLNDYNRTKLNLLEVIRTADEAYKNETGEIRHFDILVREEHRMKTRTLPQSSRSYRQGRMSRLIQGGF